MIKFDSETVGLTGPMVLLQYQEDKDIILHHIFNHTIRETLQLIEYICTQPVVGFNLVYDWFHLVKIYNCLLALSNHNDKPSIEELIQVEATNPNEYCLKAPLVCDVMLHARKGPYQATMSRRPIIIRKIPKLAATILVDELTKAIQLPKIFFTKRPYSWEILETKDENFVDLRLKFGGSSSLAALAQDALGIEKLDFPMPKHYMPTELNYLPYGQHGHRPWGKVIRQHIQVWQTYGKKYATRDVELLDGLFNKFDPPFNDDDSVLACAVGAARWKGFSIDVSPIDGLIQSYTNTRDKYPRAPGAARRTLLMVASDNQKVLITGTSKPILEALIRNYGEEEVGRTALGILEARQADRAIDFLQKVQQSKRFHPDYKIIGTRSTRMSGGSEESEKLNLNPTGIPKKFRYLFTLSDPPELLIGGDAKSYEVSILAAVVNSQKLNEQLKTGLKFHGLAGAKLLNKSYKEIVENKPLYDKTKNALFARFYGAMPDKVAKVVDIDVDDATRGLAELDAEYPEIAKEREKIYKDFCSMTQPGGLGSKVIWKDPKESVESLLGFKRYFTLENVICKALFQLSEKLPTSLHISTKVFRRDREQTVQGAIMSALFGAAFNIQSANLRQAGNHRIQSTGGQITKAFQRMLLDLQPIGVHKFLIRTLNIHDEILACTTIDTYGVHKAFIEKYSKVIPLLGWEWKTMKSWAEKS